MNLSPENSIEKRIEILAENYSKFIAKNFQIFFYKTHPYILRLFAWGAFADGDIEMFSGSKYQTAWNSTLPIHYNTLP